MAVPVACTLTEAGQHDQLAEWRALLSSCVVDVRLGTTSVAYDLDPARLDAAALLDLARREQACCAFLSFRVEVTASRTTLVITAPPEAADVLAAFAALPPA